MKHQKKLKNNLSGSFLIVLFLGTLWGFSEVVLSSAIKTAGIPYRAGILTGIGIGILAFAFTSTKKTYLIPVVAAIALFCKQLVVPILSVNLSCTANSCLAVFIQTGVVFSLLTLTRNKNYGFTGRAALGAFAGMMSAAVFYPLGLGLVPCNYLLSFASAGGMSTFLIQEGLFWALFSGVLFPAGFALGKRLSEDRVFSFQLNSGFAIVYWSLIVLLWAGSVLIISTGQYDYLLKL